MRSWYSMNLSMFKNPTHLVLRPSFLDIMYCVTDTKDILSMLKLGSADSKALSG